MDNRKLVVVIPTTHAVNAVTRLVHDILTSTICETSVIVVDNGPQADVHTWSGLDTRVSVVHHLRYLGSGEAFKAGVTYALSGHLGQFDWVLLLDHDARLSPSTLPLLLTTAAQAGDTTYSCFQGPHGAGWVPQSTVSLKFTGDVRSVPLKRAQWSGLLLPQRAAMLFNDFAPNYFFGWDDYLFSYTLIQLDLNIVGIPEAIVENNRDFTSDNIPTWRCYYQARNELLYLHDSEAPGVRSRMLVIATGRRLRVAVGMLRRGRLTSGIATLRGLRDGLLGVRGMTISPR